MLRINDGVGRQLTILASLALLPMGQLARCETPGHPTSSGPWQRTIRVERALERQGAAPRAGASPARTSRPWPDLFGRGTGSRQTNTGTRPFTTGVQVGSAGLATTLPPDTFLVAMIRIDFLTDRGGSASTGTGLFDLGTPSPSSPIDPPPHDLRFFSSHAAALDRYVRSQSYGHVVVMTDVWPPELLGAYHMSDMSDFGPWQAVTQAQLAAAAIRLARAMLFAADSQSIVRGDRVPWSTYDRILLVHAGSDHQSDLAADSPLDIPTFSLFLEGNDVVVFPDSSNRDRPIDRCAILPESLNQDGGYGALNGVLAHHFAHIGFGLADLTDPVSGQSIAGYWSLMDAGQLVPALIGLGQTELFVFGLVPPSIDPFQRQFTSNEPIPIAGAVPGDTMILHPVQRSPSARQVVLTEDESLLLENRHIPQESGVTLDIDPVTGVVLGPQGTDPCSYDALLPGRGVLVWHLDEFVIRRDAWINADSTRRGLELIEADGLDDIGNPASPFVLGAPTDPWYEGNHTLLDLESTPALRTHVGTSPRLGLVVLDPQDSVMRVLAARAPQVSVLFPAGGELLLAGGDVALVWSASDAFGVQKLRLDLSRDQGGTWETLFDDVPNAGFHPWRVTPPSSLGAHAVFRATATNGAGVRGEGHGAAFTIDYAATSVLSGPGRDHGLRIGPNPGTGSDFRISFVLDAPAAVRVRVMDVQGREVAPVWNQHLPAGAHEVTWCSAPQLAPGQYRVVFDAGSRIVSRAVAVVR